LFTPPVCLGSSCCLCQSFLLTTTSQLQHIFDLPFFLFPRSLLVIYHVCPETIFFFYDGLTDRCSPPAHGATPTLFSVPAACFFLSLNLGMKKGPRIPTPHKPSWDIVLFLSHMLFPIDIPPDIAFFSLNLFPNSWTRGLLTAVSPMTYLVAPLFHLLPRVSLFP